MSRIPAILLVLVLSIFPHPRAHGQNEGYAQQNSALEWVPMPGSPHCRFLGQRTPGNSLVLSANEVFFPKLGLKALPAKGKVRHKHLELNQRKSFAGIGEWDPGDIAEWGLFFERPGKLRMMLSSLKVGGRMTFRVSLAGKSHEISSGDFNDKSSLIRSFQYDIPRSGLFVLRVECLTHEGRGTAIFGSIHLSGTACESALVVRKRWRPKAAHAKFSCSSGPEEVDLWVFELDAKPGQLGFYAPMTTPFGYYGSTWLADGRINKGINFSLWSFGRGKKVPPTTELSHLLAIGNPEARFGGFDHEGTGVKIRNWDPFAQDAGQRQAFAARVVRGNPYDTYFTYFYDAQKERWQLFGSGRKLRSKRSRSFMPGTFVEVPGRAEKQRTGAYARRMRYRGWVLDKDRNIHRVDQMSYSDIDKKSGMTHTDRGITEDGRFFLETGGWFFRKAKHPKNSRLKLPSKASHEIPVFLSKEKIAPLYVVPSAIECSSAKRVGKNVILEVEVKNMGTKRDAVVYWGEEDLLTFAGRWPHSRKMPRLKEGKNRVRVEIGKTKGPLYFRLYLKNNQGQFWSTGTRKLDMN